MRSQSVISASLYNAARSHLIDSLRRFDRMPDEGFWATLSGTTSPYSWVETIDNYGTWTAGPRTGTTDAYEVNTHPSLNGKRAWLIPSPGGKWAFQYSRVGGAGGGGIPTSYCSCPITPGTLTMVSSNTTCSQFLQNATLVYGPAPAWSAGLLIGSSTWISTTSFIDSVTGDTFYLWFGCQTGYYTLTPIYQTSAYGSPYRDIVRYSWPIPSSGNVCAPFALTVGNPFSGSGCAANILQVTG